MSSFPVGAVYLGLSISFCLPGGGGGGPRKCTVLFKTFSGRKFL